MYEDRFYRYLSKGSFTQEIAYYESDLFIISDKKIDRSYVRKILAKYYSQVQDYARSNPEFINSLSPVPDDASAPPIARDMLGASLVAGVGPFSSVAGAIACYVGRDIANSSGEVIVENGGDIFLKVKEDKNIGIYLGENFNPRFLTVKAKKKKQPFGICSSSSKIGHSLNFGRADLLTVFAKDTILADAFATAYSNRIKKREDIDRLFAQAKKNNLIEAVIAAFSGEMFFWGDIEVLP